MIVKGPHLKDSYSRSAVFSLQLWKETGGDKLHHRNVSDVIRHWTEFTEITNEPMLVSVNALKVAESKGIDLETIKWASYNKQTKSIKNGGLGESSRKNGKFHFEHLVPVSYIFNIIKDIEDLTPQKFCEIMDSIAQGAWITKEEMKRLDKINKSNKRTEEDLKMANIEWV